MRLRIIFGAVGVASAIFLGFCKPNTAAAGLGILFFVFVGVPLIAVALAGPEPSSYHGPIYPD